MVKNIPDNRTLIFFGAVLGLICFILPVNIVFPFIIILTGLLVAMLLPYDCSDNFIRELFLAAFISRIFLALLLYLALYLKTGSGLMGDSYGYSENGFRILNLWLGGIRDKAEIIKIMSRRSVSGTLATYDFWNAIVYFFSGKSPLTVIFINCLAGSLTAVVIFYIARGIGGNKTAKIAGVLTAFWPSTFFWSIQNLKEPATVFLITSLVLVFLKLRAGFRVHLFFLMILCSILLKELRLFVLALFYAAVMPFSFLLSLWRKRRLEITIFILIFAAAAFFYLDAIKTNLIGGLLSTEINESFLKWVYKMRTYRTLNANSAFLENFNFTNPWNFSIFIPASLIVIMFAPFPWQLGSFLQIMAVPEMLIYYVLFPSMLFGAYFIMRYKMKEGGVILSYILIITAVLSLIEGNVGTLFRHRAMLWPFYMILIALGLSRHNFKITYREI